MGNLKSCSVSDVYWIQIGFESTAEKRSRRIYENVQQMVQVLCDELINKSKTEIFPLKYVLYVRSRILNKL